MSERIAKRLLIVGWDAADWKIIDTLFAHGGMPNLRRMVERGVRANLASLEPRLSPLLWTSIATGKTADKHGILNFVEPDPAGDGLRIISSTTRKTKAIWNILTQSGMRTNVVSWYASHPAEPIQGVCVSNLFEEGMPAASGDPWPMAKGAIHPASMADEIAELRLHPGELRMEEVWALLPTLPHIGRDDGRLQMLIRHIAQCSSIHNVATSLLISDEPWDCTMIFHDTIDSVGHNFMQYHPPRMPHVSERDYELYRNVMISIYQLHDLMLGALLQLAGEETTVILLSDHGFFSDYRRPVVKDMTAQQRAEVEASWHRPLGVLAMAGPGIKKGEKIFGASLLEILPTALALLGLPVGADMGGRVLLEAFDRPVKVETVFSWDLIAGEAGMHPPDMRQDPFETQDAINQLVDLGYMSAMPEDTKAKVDMARRESQCNLGTVFTMSGQADKAIPVFDELVKESPRERRYLFGLARAQFTARHFGDCAGTLRRFIGMNPSSVEAQVMLGLALGNAGKDQEALEQLSEIERKHGDRKDLAAALGDLSMLVGRFDDAYRHYLAALEIDPEGIQVHHGLAKAAIGLRQFEEAADHCLQAVERVHFFPEAHQSLGISLTWMKDYEHAIKAFEVAISMQPSLIEAHRYLASIYRHLKDQPNAAKHKEIAERLLNERNLAGAEGRSIDFLKRQMPLGPQDWVKHIGE